MTLPAQQPGHALRLFEMVGGFGLLFLLLRWIHLGVMAGLEEEHGERVRDRMDVERETKPARRYRLVPVHDEEGDDGIESAEDPRMEA